MPIRPEMRERYPDNWPEIRARILQRADDKCEWCGVENHELGGRDPSGTFHHAMPLGDNGLRLLWPSPGDWARCSGWSEDLRIIRIVLTIAHIHDHSPENCDDDNLAALCQRCHNIHDAPMRRAGRIEREREAMGMDDLFKGDLQNDG